MIKLPFNPGDDLWILDEEHDYNIICEKGGVAGVAIMADGEYKIINKQNLIFSVGQCGVYPSEDLALAEQKRLQNTEI